MVLIASGIGVAALAVIGRILKSKAFVDIIEEEILIDVEPFQIRYFGDIKRRSIIIPDDATKITFENFVGILGELKDVVGKDAKIDPEMTQIWLHGKE